MGPFPGPKLTGQPRPPASQQAGNGITVQIHKGHEVPSLSLPVGSVTGYPVFPCSLKGRGAWAQTGAA